MRPISFFSVRGHRVRALRARWPVLRAPYSRATMAIVTDRSAVFRSDDEDEPITCLATSNRRRVMPCSRTLKSSARLP
jgi:hypothetical protein